MPIHLPGMSDPTSFSGSYEKSLARHLATAPVNAPEPVRLAADVEYTYDLDLLDVLAGVGFKGRVLWASPKRDLPPPLLLQHDPSKALEFGALQTLFEMIAGPALGFRIADEQLPDPVYEALVSGGSLTREGVAAYLGYDPVERGHNGCLVGDVTYQYDMRIDGWVPVPSATPEPARLTVR